MAFYRFHGLPVFHHFSEFLAHFLSLWRLSYPGTRRPDRTLWRKDSRECRSRGDTDVPPHAPTSPGCLASTSRAARQPPNSKETRRSTCTVRGSIDKPLPRLG